MRTITVAQTAVVEAEGQANFARLQVKDVDGNWRDLTTWPGFNAVLQLSWKAKINDPHMTFDATLARECYELSLSPFMEGSALNHAFDPDEDFAPLIALNREVKIEVAIVAMDSAPTDDDWMLVFTGRIDQIDAAKGKEISLSGRDMGGRLAQQYIKKERIYAFASDGGMVSLQQWYPEAVVTTDDRDTYWIPASRGAANGDTPADSGYNKFVQLSNSGGTTGLEEPDWDSGPPIVDGTVEWGVTGAPDLGGFAVEDVIQKILHDNVLEGDTEPTLYVPVSPAWAVTEFQVQRGFTLDAIRALASQIGWDIRYKWKASPTFDFVLTLYEPERDSPSSMYTFSPSMYGEPTRLALDIAQIRNSVLVIYKDRSDLHLTGEPKRKQVRATDPDSIDEFGELWSELQEDENGNIDTETEATRLAESFISDCAWPTAEVSVPLMRGFPWVELNDFYTFEADDVRTSENLQLAVTGWSQDFADGQLSTKLELRGLPTAGHQVHIDKEYHPTKPKRDLVHRFQHFPMPTTEQPKFREIVGGVFMEFQAQQNLKKTNILTEYEIHISEDIDFSPSVDTLVATINGTSQAVPYQNPNVDQIDGAPREMYGRVIPKYYNSGQVVRGQPSRTQAFNVGRARAAHMVDGMALGDYPLNGGFETRFSEDDFPDHWYGGDALASYVLSFPAELDTDVFVMEDGNGVSGERYIKFVANDSYGPILASAKIPITCEGIETDVRYGTAHRMTFWGKADADNDSGGALSIFIQLVDFEDNNLGFAQFLFITSDDKVGKWVKYEANFRMPASDDARSAYIYMKSNLAEATYYVDEVRITPIGSPWYAVGETDQYTDNYESVPDFGDGWGNYGSPHEAAAFRKDKHGRVHIKGLVQHEDDNTTGTGNAVFRLPVGYRPDALIHLATTANGKHAQLEIDTDGYVYVGVADDASWATTYLSINCEFETWDEDVFA